MRVFKFIPVALLGALGACVLAPSTTRLAPPELVSVSDARLDFIGITGTLPEAGNELAPVMFDSLNDLVPVRLDLIVRPPLDVSVAAADGTYTPLADCGFGPVDAGEVSVPTGSNHMLLSVRLGTPSEHAANLLSCDYDASVLTDTPPGRVVRLRGCFLPQSVSIPTAVQWVLNPLPASACDLGN